MPADRASAHAVVAALVATVACSRTPEPSPSPTIASSQSAKPAASASSVADAPPLTDVEAFCAGAYFADATMLKDKCSAKDYEASVALERSGARFCAKDLTTLLGFGRAKLDVATGTACGAALKAAAASAAPETHGSFFTIPPCDRVVVGTAAEGGACRFPPECGDGLTCVGYAVGVDGVCRKPGRVGGACSTQAFGGVFNESALTVHHASCVTGAYCDGKACVARKADGATCTASKTCGEDHVCVMGKCASARSTAGGACARNDECAAGLYCDGTSCAAKKSAGEPCKQDQCKGWCDVPAKPPWETDGVCVASCGSG